MLPGCAPWPAELAQRYRRDGLWRGEPLGELLRPYTRDGDGRTAVVCGTRRISYPELDAWADQLAAGLIAHGIGTGDRILVQLPNIPEFLAFCIASFRVGAVPVLTLASLRHSELVYLARLTDAVAYVIPDTYQRCDHRELARQVCAAAPTVRQVFVVGQPQEFHGFGDLARPVVPLPDVDPAEVAFFLLSGGTTGLPKLIPRTHDDYALQLRETARAMGFGAGDAYLAALPVAHNAALGCPGVLGALHVGGVAVLAQSASPDEVFPLVARESVRLTTLMPAFLPLWVELAPLFNIDLSRLVIEVGGARLAPEVARQVRPSLGCTLTRWFGMAEGLLSFTRLDEPEAVLVGTEGRPLCAQDEIRVVDDRDEPVPPGTVGEMLVRGPYTIRGYYRADEYNAQAFTDDGFLRTGDLVRIDEQGHLVVEGRSKDVINRGGEKVSPGEVEEHLLAHPGVAEVAVVAVDDDVLGEKTCAVLVPAGTAPGLGELRAFLTDRGLAGYKLPDQLRIVASLPRTGVGKVDRRALRVRA